MDIQVKILRTLQEKDFERVGGDRLIHSDFRLLAATNQDLRVLIEQNRFRHDLYYRLNVFPIHIPPLRERPEDIPLLAVHFLEMFNQKLGKNLKGLTNRQIKELQQYRWPGNVRELKHVIERAAIMSEGAHLVLPDLAQTMNNGPEKTKLFTMKEMERQHILAALAACNWRVSGQGGAAEILDMKPTTLYARIRKLGIEKKMT
jgi:transcriptional regulator with GAF, ATPase, and Fis domain